MTESEPRVAHAFVRLAGHGVHVLPTPPFELVRQADSVRVAIVHAAADAPVETIVPPESGADIDPRIGTIAPGPDDPSWRLEVGGVYAIDWPDGVIVRSWPEPDEPPFFIFSAGEGAMFYVQGVLPRERVPALRDLVGEGQRIVALDEGASIPWVELAYRHRDEPWRQRHFLVPFGDRVVPVSTQAPAAAAASLHAVASAAAASVRPYRPPS